MIMKKTIYCLIALMMTILVLSCGDGEWTEIYAEATKGNPPAENVIDDDGVPNGSPGNESMFGVYSHLGTNSDTWKSFKDEAETNVTLHLGDRSYWENHHIEVPAIWIVDEKTIYWVDDYIGFFESKPTSDKESILLESEPYTVNYSKVVVGRWQQYTAYYYLVHYIYKIRNTDRWEGRYAMNGSKMIVHTDETTKWENGREFVAVDYNTLTWDYSDGVIDVDGIKYVKMK